MKAEIGLAALMLVAAGCKQEPARHDDRIEKQRAVAPNIKTPAGPKQQVAGAFGFQLGEQVSWATDATNDDGGYDLSGAERTKVPPFDLVTVSFTRGGQIYQIRGSTAHMENAGSYYRPGDLEPHPDNRFVTGLDAGQYEPTKRTLLESLEEKYGFKSRTEDGATFGKGDREISLVWNDTQRSIEIKYTDLNLREAVRAETAKRNEASAKRTAGAL